MQNLFRLGLGGAACALLSLVLSGCGAEGGGPSEVTSREQAASLEHNRVLGFETPQADWHTTNGSSLVASTTVTQGSTAAAVTPNGYTEVVSTTVPAPGGARSTATVDIRLPAQLGWGEARMVVRIPSQNQWWRDLGSVSLSGRPAGTYHTLSFAVPEDLRTALNSSATDVDYRIILNVPYGSGTYLLDNMVIADQVTTGGSTPTTGVELRLAVPQGLAIPDVMLSGSNQVTIDDRSILGESGKLTEVADLGSGKLEFGAVVQTYANVTSVGAVDFLRSQSHIYGKLTTGANVIRQDNVTVDGGIFPSATVTPAVTSWTVDWPAGVTRDISRSPDSPNFPIEAGGWDSIQVFSRATVTLKTGTYFVNSLVVEPQAHIRIDNSAGPVIIYVKETLRFNAPLEYIGGGERGQVLFGYVGQQTALFQEAIVASVVAPNSELELRRPNNNAPHEGSFFAKHVHVFSNATVKHIPLDWDFLCAAGDLDKDGTFDCWDECTGNKTKTRAGVCGCFASDDDVDGDGVPGCVDQCNAEGVAYHGQCGCPPNAAPAGTPCNDGVVAGVFECDGAGTCGDPSSAEPEDCCELRTLGQRAYWVCNGCGGGGSPATHDQAVARCAADSGRALVRIDDRQENAFLAQLLTHVGANNVRIGGLDGNADGNWAWANAAGAESVRFWAGGAEGRPHRGMYESWGTAQPADEAGQCSVLRADGTWATDDCSVPRAYICESTLGAARDPGGSVPTDPEPQTPADPQPLDCVNPPPTEAQRDAAEAQAQACRTACDADGATDESCRAACDDSPYTMPPAPGDVCVGAGASASRPGVFYPGTCSATSPTCAPNPWGPPLTCRQGVECLDVYWQNAGYATGLSCTTDSQCPNGRCNLDQGTEPGKGLCTDTRYDDSCDKRLVNGTCYGFCYSTLGCGIGGGTQTDTEVTEDCVERSYCAPEYVDGFENDDLSQPSEFQPTSLDDSIEEDAPAFSDDFESPGSCTGQCLECGDRSWGCPREQQHAWCRYDATSPGAPSSDTTDNRDGVRGKDSTALKVTFDPEATLQFDVEPLPLGLSRFDATAAAAASSDVSFNFLGIGGHVELFELRAELSASLCRVHSTNSRAELLGIDFLPRLAEESGALFDTDELVASSGFSSEDCEKAIDAYIEAVDRAKKALRDAQELVTQYKELLEADPENPRTFAEGFCEELLGDGPRPPLMKGSCGTDTSPADTVNAFVDYYHEQLKQIEVFKNGMAQAALSGSELASLLPLPDGGIPGTNGFSYFVPFGDGLGGTEETTIVSIQFFIGPIPCLLEVGAKADYGIKGGFGIDVEPSSMITGGPLASAGAQVTPHLSSSVTLFAGAGFNIGGFEMKLGLTAALTLVSVDLPATARAGLKVSWEKDPRGIDEIPASLANLSVSKAIGYPLDGTRRRYNYSFAYDYGVDLVLSNILSGSVHGTVKISFFFFSIGYSQRLLQFQGLDPITLNLIGGGTFDEDTQKHEQPVVSESQQPWKAAYESVPFMRLDPVPAPPADVVADADLDTDRAGEFLYDNLCQCTAYGQACNRDDDCCTYPGDSASSCFSDPAQASAAVCSTCRKPGFTNTEYLRQINLTEQQIRVGSGYYQSCNTADDCCNSSDVCDRASVPTKCSYKPGPFGALEWSCDFETPPYNVCHRPIPPVDDPDVR